VYIRHNKIRNNRLPLFLVGLLLILEGCSSGYAPVSERSVAHNNKVEVAKSSRRQKAPESYRVKNGDTLYSIAWRYGLDYRQVARINSIGSDFRIDAGQELRLKTGASYVKVANKPTSNVKTPTVVQKPIRKKAVASKIASPRKEPSKASSSKVEQVKVASSQVSDKNVALPYKLQKVKWRWPAAGKVINGYSSKGSVNKGINLAGSRGEPVYAAASGKVVYAGSGLLGYGNLIIINHNREYLSAYAHNSLILVKENENVNVGAKVAEIGNSGATRMMLHFEIRKDGKPVNPLRYLPKR
jgi:lipoprotein NlpD